MNDINKKEQAALINLMGRMIDDLCAGNVDDVILKLTKMQHALKREHIEHVDDRRPPSLPLLPKVKPVAGKRLQSKDVSCPSCKAKPGTECFVMTGPGRSSKPTDVRRTNGSVHKTRTAKAKAAS